MSEFKMPDVNEVRLAGRLTRDPETIVVGAGSTLCKFGLAVSRRFKGKDGASKEETVFVDVTTRHKTAHWCGDTLHKGSPVLVGGSLTMDEWEDRQTGAKRTKLLVTAARVQSLAWPDDQPASGPPQDCPSRLPRVAQTGFSADCPVIDEGPDDLEFAPF